MTEKGVSSSIQTTTCCHVPKVSSMPKANQHGEGNKESGDVE